MLWDYTYLPNLPHGSEWQDNQSVKTDATSDPQRGFKVGIIISHHYNVYITSSNVTKVLEQSRSFLRTTL
ncbi:hypothetical protein J6590_004030 [Homalodisca vitripennis]|nr:hypothetical protein J6590_004030 [Homalodisca vitripennis]